ncbi:hypothetical protein CEXT_577701, partial [Caerostris extrusa]
MDDVHRWIDSPPMDDVCEYGQHSFVGCIYAILSST